MIIEKIEQILFNEKQIKERIRVLASEISRDYYGKSPVLVGILNGSVIFLSDLIRELEINFTIDFISVSSYSGTERTEKLELNSGMKLDPLGKDILLVEDIVDTGYTLDFVKKGILLKRPASLKVCALLDKKTARKLPVKLDYTGFVVPEKYVVGYGLDYDGKHRGLPYIGAIK